MRIISEQIVTAGDMAANVTSLTINLNHMSQFNVQALFTGSPVGAIKIQQSNDGTNWDDVPASSVSVSAAGSQSWNLYMVGYPWARLVYTRTSGTGTLNATVYAKGF